MPLTLVNIISVSYSGSTWLNLVLGSHSRAFSAGELTSIRRRGKPVCRLHGEACPTWARFDAESSENIADKIAHASGREWIIVNNPRDYQKELDASDHPQKFIHLVRDGRAVAASELRKFPKHWMWGAARRWKRSVRKNQSRLRRRPEEDVRTVRYEDLVKKPEEHVPGLCDFLGLPFEPAMLRYWEREHCFLGGSRGTIYTLAREQNVRNAGPQQPKNPGVKFDAGFYDRASVKNFVDERWKSELTPRQLRIFRLLAGGLNRGLGYK